jgi:rod shape-determining protein MreD
VRFFWTGLGLVLALVAQSMLSTLLPQHALMLDPFLIVLVYVALHQGETPGMVVGSLAGWIQDVFFGGQVMGLSGLTKLLLGFAVGVASARFHLTEPAARVLVLFVASLADSLVFRQLAVAFELPVLPLSALGIVSRAALNAGVGLALYEAMERKWGRERRARP